MKKNPGIKDFKPRPLASKLSPQRIRVINIIRRMTIKRVNAQMENEKKQQKQIKQQKKKQGNRNRGIKNKFE